MSAADPDGFRRVPGYLRGHAGVVVAECGDRPRPVGRAQDDVVRTAEPVLTVRFDAERVFGATGTGSWLHADLWLSDLEEVP